VNPSRGVSLAGDSMAGHPLDGGPGGCRPPTGGARRGSVLADGLSAADARYDLVRARSRL